MRKHNLATRKLTHAHKFSHTHYSEGIDVKLAVHYFSRMALTDALLPALRNGRSPRVLSVLSGGVHSVYEGYKTDFELKTSYSLKNAADAAGFYNDLCLDAFSKYVCTAFFYSSLCVCVRMLCVCVVQVDV